MTRKDIIKLPNPNLRKPSRKIVLFDKDLIKLIDDMVSATLDWEDSRKHEVGVALAAIQIDQAVRVIIVRNDFDKREDRTFSVLVNPEIVKLEGEILEDFEGCLSVSDLYGKVPRHSKIRIKAMDENGQPVKFKAEGFLARVLQHEIDHTKGKLFIDHIEGIEDAFYVLQEDGKLKQLEYSDVDARNLFR